MALKCFKKLISTPKFLFRYFSQVISTFGRTSYLIPGLSVGVSPKKALFPLTYLSSYCQRLAFASSFPPFGSIATKSFPVNPTEALNFKDSIPLTLLKKFSFDTTHAAETEGKNPHRLSFGKLAEPSYR
ncbi:hypothetical protein D3C81_1093100 [compost metagenome]